MPRAPFWSIAAGLALTIASIAFAADPPSPTTRPTESAIGDVRVQSFKAYTYCFVSAETTLNTLQDAIGKLIPKVDAAMDGGQLRPTGPVIFTYHLASADRNKRFTLDVGAMVKDGTTPPADFKIAIVPASQSATVLCTGPLSMLPGAFGKLYGEIGRQGLQSTDVSREWYLYFEDPESANNVVQIQAELAPPPAAPAQGL